MMAPLYKFDLFGSEFGLVFAFVIGIGFGFFLEKAGFGSGKKLAAQFYFKDLTVFKVMFTAIVTAMVGIYFLTWFGFLDHSLLYIGNTYIVPQIVGGLILGVGFVIGGYCPGTSAVAMSTGKIDAAVFLLGIIAGIFVFGELYPFMADFIHSTDMGRFTLMEFTGIPYGTIVFAVVLIAIGGFAGAEWVEKKFGYKKERVE
ncbi:YeeE/YedE thiosulfate transporter family protein [Bacteroidota bacterium]